MRFTTEKFLVEGEIFGQSKTLRVRSTKSNMAWLTLAQARFRTICQVFQTSREKTTQPRDSTIHEFERFFGKVSQSIADFIPIYDRSQ